MYILVYSDYFGRHQIYSDVIFDSEITFVEEYSTNLVILQVLKAHEYEIQCNWISLLLLYPNRFFFLLYPNGILRNHIIAYQFYPVHSLYL